MNADNLTGDELLAGRKKIRAVVPVGWNKTEIDIRYEAVEAMKALGAVDIKDFKSVKPTPKDHQRFGKRKIRAFTATALNKEDING